MWHKIKCPNCNTGEISINLQVLASGEGFPCSHCGALVSVSKESQDVVKKGVDEFLTMQKESVDFSQRDSTCH